MYEGRSRCTHQRMSDFQCIVKVQIDSIVYHFNLKTLISLSFAAKRKFVMSSSPSRSGSGSRSRSRSRSPRPRRRGSPIARSPSQSDGEGHGGAGQYESQSSNRSRSSKVQDRKRRRSRSEDPDTPRRHASQALVPLNYSRHAEEESSDTSEVDDEGQENDRLEGLDRSRSRSKKIRKVDVSNPLSTFRKQVRQRPSS